MTGKKNTISLWKTLMFVFMQKIKFIPYLFLEILQRYCKLVILATLGVTGNTHQKRYQLLIENSGVYLQTKNQLDPYLFSRDITL